MEGFMMVGKAFAVCEDLRVLAEQNKGKTVFEVLQERKAKEVPCDETTELRGKANGTI